jgi:excisionase family DNA binding protein
MITKEVAGVELQFYCPELEIRTQESLSRLTAERLTSRLLEHWRKIDRKLTELAEENHPYPSPMTLLDARDLLGGTSRATLSTREAAARLEVSISTVKRLVDQKVLRAEISEGGHRRVLRESVERYRERLQRADAEML